MNHENNQIKRDFMWLGDWEFYSRDYKKRKGDMMNFVLMNIYNTGAIFAALLVACIAFGPMVYGISLCLHNERLSVGMKLLWCLAFLSSSVVALLVYFALYKRQPSDEE